MVRDCMERGILLQRRMHAKYRHGIHHNKHIQMSGIELIQRHLLHDTNLIPTPILTFSLTPSILPNRNSPRARSQSLILPRCPSE
jgi:hypothetical protein